MHSTQSFPKKYNTSVFIKIKVTYMINDERAIIITFDN